MAVRTVKYIKEYFEKVEHKKDICKPYGQSQSGYGSKIATQHLLKLNGKGPWRRVYAVCFSNVASHYVVVLKVRYYVTNECDQGAIDE